MAQSQLQALPFYRFTSSWPINNSRDNEATRSTGAAAHTERELKKLSVVCYFETCHEVKVKNPIIEFSSLTFFLLLPRKKRQQIFFLWVKLMLNAFSERYRLTRSSFLPPARERENKNKENEEGIFGNLRIRGWQIRKFLIIYLFFDFFKEFWIFIVFFWKFSIFLKFWKFD